MTDRPETPPTPAEWERITGAARQGQDPDMLAHQELTRAGDRLLRALAPLFWAALGAIVVVVLLSLVEVVG